MLSVQKNALTLEKNWKMGEIWKNCEFLIWSTRLTHCVVAPDILSWGLINVFHIVANIKTSILSTWSGQKVILGLREELPTFSWPVRKINFFQNIFNIKKMHNSGISCPILIILGSKLGFLRSGNILVRVSRVIHLSFMYLIYVLAHKTPNSGHYKLETKIRTVMVLCAKTRFWYLYDAC